MIRILSAVSLAALLLAAPHLRRRRVATRFRLLPVRTRFRRLDWPRSWSG